MKSEPTCDIVFVGKRRDGKKRYWCVAHGSDATRKGGGRLQRCARSDVPEIATADILELDPRKHRGGIALWGAVPAVYSTAAHDMADSGVHAHARRSTNHSKQIDQTYKRVIVRLRAKGRPEKAVVIEEEEAIYYMVSSVFGHPMKYVECTHCHKPHLDKDWFSVHAHRKHLCSGCGRTFHDVGPGIGNPLIGVQTYCGDSQLLRKTQLAPDKLDIRQQDFPLGIELWGTNPAILWTSSKPEACGVHFHGYTSNFFAPEIDETFSKVVIDGITIDDAQLRVLMAQSALPHLVGRVLYLECPRCDAPHYDTGELAYTPHRVHVCECGKEFTAPGRMKNVIGNPMVGTLAALEAKAPLTRRKFVSTLRPET